jgi:hypothetical protein
MTSGGPHAVTEAEHARALLAAAGVTRVRGGRGELYLRCGRWLVRRSHFLRFSSSHLCRWRDLLRVRGWFLSADGQTSLAPLMLLREDGRPKLSVFDLDKGVRRVQFLRRADFDGEIEAIGHFASRGLSVPKAGAVDEVGLCYQQQLVLDPMRARFLTTPVEVMDQIEALAAAGQPEWLSATEFLSRCAEAVEGISGHIGSGLSGFLGGLLDRAGSRDGRFPGLKVPMLRCHGDLSTGNVLRGEDGRVYLIDFDRSFVANAWFDAIYYSRVAGLPESEEGLLIGRVTSRLGMKADAGGLFGWVDPAGLTALDLAVYVHRRLLSVESGPDRLCRYSLDLMEKLRDR